MGAGACYHGAMRKVVLLACVAAVLGASVCAQPHTQREPGLRRTCYFQEGDERVIVHAGGNPPNRLTWSTRARPRPTLDLPFDVPGSPAYLGDWRLLVGGIRSRDGVATLMTVRLDAASSAIEIEQSQEYGVAFDPYGVACNPDEGLLYVLDIAGERILVAPFDGRVLPPAGEFFTAVREWELGSLHLGYLAYLERPHEHLEWQRGDLERRGKPRHFPGENLNPGVLIRENDCLAPPIYHVWHQDGAWEIDNIRVGPPEHRVAIAHRSRVNSVGPVLAGDVRGAVELRDRVFAHDLISTTELGEAPGLEWTALGLPAEGLVPGLWYSVAPATGRRFRGERFLALARHGAPEESALVAMHPGTLSGVFLGNTELRVGTSLRAGLQAALPLDVDLYLWMGVRNEDGVDPVEVQGESVCLTEVLAIAGPVRATARNGSYPCLVGARVPVPDDPELLGGVVLCQWAAVVPGHSAVTVSDVFGAMVSPPWPDERLREPQESPAAEKGAAWLRAAQASLPRVPKASVAAVRRWLGSREDWAVEGEGLRVWRRRVPE